MINCNQYLLIDHHELLITLHAVVVGPQVIAQSVHKKPGKSKNRIANPAHLFDQRDDALRRVSCRRRPSSKMSGSCLTVKPKDLHLISGLRSDSCTNIPATPLLVTRRSLGAHLCRQALGKT